MIVGYSDFGMQKSEVGGIQPIGLEDDLLVLDDVSLFVGERL